MECGIGVERGENCYERAALIERVEEVREPVDKRKVASGEKW
jgi:hypothetical protein